MNLKPSELKMEKLRHFAISVTVASAFCATLSNPAHAAAGDTSLTQRAGYVLSRGDLSRDKTHHGHMFSVTRTFDGPMSFLNIESMHRISILYDSFYTLGDDNLLFPVIPHAQSRLIEPSLNLEFCIFARSFLRPCASVGFSAVYLQSTIQNYQIYAALPVEARIIYNPSDKIYFFEAGARYRTFQNRVGGYVAKHIDLMPFIGIGLFFSGR